MWTPFQLATLGVALAGLAGIILVRRSRTERATARLVADLLAASTTEPDRVVRPSDFSSALPAPVRRYLETVLREGQPYVQTLRVEQHGTFRGDESASWSPFTATQHVTTRPPGFVWNATVKMMPVVPVRVLDAYHDGRGTLRATLGGVLPVMAGEPGPALDEGELLRYLAEAPLYPTALLPGGGVEWSPIDDASARATLVHGDTKAALTFHFNDRNEVVRVEGQRGFTHKDGTVEPRPWVGYWRRYRTRGGMRVPTEGEVAWRDPKGGAWSYWRGQMDRLSYRPELGALPARRGVAASPGSSPGPSSIDP